MSAVVVRAKPSPSGLTGSRKVPAADPIGAYRTVLACELLGAVRALRLGEVDLPRAPVSRAFERAAPRLPLIREDHPLSGEIAHAELLTDEFADY